MATVTKTFTSKDKRIDWKNADNIGDLNKRWWNKEDMLDRAWAAHEDANIVNSVDGLPEEWQNIIRRINEYFGEEIYSEDDLAPDTDILHGENDIERVINQIQDKQLRKELLDDLEEYRMIKKLVT